MYRVVTAEHVIRGQSSYDRGSFFGNIARAVVGVVGGAVTGVIKTKSPIGGIIGAVGGAIGATKANIASDQREAAVATAPPLAPPPMIQVQAPMMNAGAAIPPGVITMSPGGTPVSQAAIDRQIAALGGVSAGGKGMHPNKSWTYSRKTGLAAPHTKMVRNRTMNWANGKAVGRAERRIKSFVKHAQRYIRWVSPGRKGRAAPKFRRK